MRSRLLAARTAERRTRVHRLTEARTAAARRRATAAAQAAAYATEASRWQTRLEAQTDHQLLAQLAAEDRAQLDAYAQAGIHDPTRGPGTCLRRAA